MGEISHPRQEAEGRPRSERLPRKGKRALERGPGERAQRGQGSLVELELLTLEESLPGEGVSLLGLPRTEGTGSSQPLRFPKVMRALRMWKIGISEGEETIRYHRPPPHTVDPPSPSPKTPQPRGSGNGAHQS